MNVNYQATVALASLGMKDCILICCFIQITEPASYVCFNFVVLHWCKPSSTWKSDGGDRCYYHRNFKLGSYLAFCFDIFMPLYG